MTDIQKKFRNNADMKPVPGITIQEIGSDKYNTYVNKESLDLTN
jgi:hypothetical protein